MRGVLKREQIKTNIDHLHEVCAAACWLSSLDLPVRLIVVPEGGLQGFTDEVFDWDHKRYAEEIAIDIPGPETDQLGKLAKEFNCYLVATAKAHEPEFPGLFFNVVFLISPQGKVILKHRKNSPLFPKTENLFFLSREVGASGYRLKHDSSRFKVRSSKSVYANFEL